MEKYPLGRRWAGDPAFRRHLSAAGALGVDVAYALYHGFFGIYHLSLWFVTLCAYYLILSALRGAVLLCVWKGGREEALGGFVLRLSGGLLAGLSLVLSGMVYLCMTGDLAMVRGEIMMITIAAYTFGKLGMAIGRAIRHRKNPSPFFAVLRATSYGAVAASVLNLQWSMIPSFGGMDPGRAHVLNVLTGAAACGLVLCLGISVLKKGLHQKG